MMFFLFPAKASKVQHVLNVVNESCRFSGMKVNVDNYVFREGRIKHHSEMPVIVHNYLRCSMVMLLPGPSNAVLLEARRS
ncbi:hypothetical protein RJT34_30037 [Clitoria ternatea]|uniref:Uncharacterized protein n=1 Tax=Clitoria ternatea TaxID=43366 RepID=A0AAN9I2A1_CLITE